MAIEFELPKSLPIFRVSAPQVNLTRLYEVAGALFGVDEFSARERGTRQILESGLKVVETNTNSGGLWAADKERLWRPQIRPELPSDEDAQKRAESMFRENKLLPSLRPSQPFEVGFSGMGATWMAIGEGNTDREVRRLDTQVNYAVRFRRNDIDVPLVGGGGGFKVTFGDGGEVIGYSGVWRDVEDAELEAAVIAPEVSKAEFEKLVSQLEIVDVETDLAYYAAPMRASQTYLYPVYVYRATAQLNDERVPLRVITLPATKFGPFMKAAAPQPVRNRDTHPSAAPRKPMAAEIQQQARLAARTTRALRLNNPYEAGTSWIGLSGGLSGSQNNAKGFVDGLAADGWNVNFNWGDGAAWESDWHREDDRWVDAADFVFYTGHASMNGWMLSNPDDGFLHFSEVGSNPQSPGDHWGQQDLEWVIVAACGPLQDEVIGAGGGNVLNRWGGAFDGLHQLLGYGGITFDNQEEGETVIEYARDGDPVIDAWFRAAREIQPSTNGASPPNGPDIWVGAMYVYRNGETSPRNDHIWKHGSVAPDPTSPNVRVCMWTTT